MQRSFSDLEYAAKKKLTRRDRFLAEIDRVTPWGKMHQPIKPFYPEVSGPGRPPIELARMLRMYVAQQCIVDATLIAAPPSTEHKDGERDPEMHQSKKGNDWHFGMKADIGVDAASGLVHTLIGTASNVSDVTQAHALLHGDETAALGGAGYQRVEKRDENRGKSVTWHVAMKRSKRKALPKNKVERMLE